MCGYCCGSTPQEKRGEAHRNCSAECYSAPRRGRPLGKASGGKVGFWDRLGFSESLLPAHLPMGVTESGEGPEDDEAAHHYVCWCGDLECPLTLALNHAWASGRRSVS